MVLCSMQMQRTVLMSVICTVTRDHAETRGMVARWMSLVWAAPGGMLMSQGFGTELPTPNLGILGELALGVRDWES